MDFLAICTVSRSTLIAMRVGDKTITKVLQFSRHSENLFPLLTQTLDEHKLSLDDFDCFACVVGPGSFTGIRIGMSVIKGFAFALNKPVVTLGSLELLAYNRRGKTSKSILAVINAGAGMVYHQQFECAGGALSPLYQPKLDKINHFEAFYTTALGGEPEIAYCQNDEKNTDYSAKFGGSQEFLVESLAQAVADKIANGEFTTAVEASPLYLRVSSAEQNIKDLSFERLGSGDIEEIMRLESMGDEFDLPWGRQATLDSLNNPAFECYGLKNSEGLWAMISVMNVASECEILRVVVDKKARELGLGGRIISQIIDLKRGQGMESLFLEVNERNFPALSLYQKSGFQSVGERKKYYKNIDSAILMKLSLL